MARNKPSTGCMAYKQRSRLCYFIEVVYSSWRKHSVTCALVLGENILNRPAGNLSIGLHCIFMNRLDADTKTFLDRPSLWRNLKGQGIKSIIEKVIGRLLAVSFFFCTGPYRMDVSDVLRMYYITITLWLLRIECASSHVHVPNIYLL